MTSQNPNDILQAASHKVKESAGNKSRQLEFFIPDDIAEGSYRIRLKTFFSKSGQNLKTAISTVSDVIQIRS